MQIKFGKTLMNLKNSKQQWKHIKSHRTVLTYSWKECNKEIWQERMNAQDRNKELKMQNVQGAVLKGAFSISEVTNTPINLKNNKNISGKELRLQWSNVIKICAESLTFLGMTNLEGDNIKRQYLSKMLPVKLVLLTKDIPTPSEFLLGNNLIIG